MVRPVAQPPCTRDLALVARHSAMRSSRFLAGVLVALFCVALVGNAPVHATPAAVDPRATTVTGACSGGPGRMSVTVHPPAAGEYRVEVTVRGLAEGSRWAVHVGQRGATPSLNPTSFAVSRLTASGRWRRASRPQRTPRTTRTSSASPKSVATELMAALSSTRRRRRPLA